MKRSEMIKWLSENTTVEGWSNGLQDCLPRNCGWYPVKDMATMTYVVHRLPVRMQYIRSEDIIRYADVFQPVPDDNSSVEYINNSRTWFKSSMKPRQWGNCSLPHGWKWSDTNHDMNTVIEHETFTVVFNYSDIFGVGEMHPKPVLPPEKGKELFIDGGKYKLFHDETNGMIDSGSTYTYDVQDDLFSGDESLNIWMGDAVRTHTQGARVEFIHSVTPTKQILTPGPVQAPDSDTLYWDKHNKKYCYIVGSAWDDGALFFAEEFVDGDVTGNYFGTERMNLMLGEEHNKRATITKIIEEEINGDNGTMDIVKNMANRIFNEVINHAN